MLGTQNLVQDGLAITAQIVPSAAMLSKKVFAEFISG
jgi:hypothetical protein